MRKHHVLALALSGILVVLIIVDRVVLLTTGHATVVTDDSRGSTVAAVAMSILMGAAFGALAQVVRREKPRFGSARRPARAVQPVLAVGLLVMSVAFLVPSPLQLTVLDEDSPVAQVFSLLGLLAITGVLGSALLLGVALVGRNPLGVGGRVLGALGPVIALTVIVGLLAPDFATPMYGTVVLLLGVALLGVRAEPTPQPDSRAATASPTAAV